MKRSVATAICLLALAWPLACTGDVGVVQEGPDRIRLICRSNAPRLVGAEAGEATADPLALAGAAPVWEPGRPSLPVYRVCLAVPRGAKVTLATRLISERTVVLDRELEPMQPPPHMSRKGKAARPVKDRRLYASDGPYPADRARIVNRGFVRDLEVVTVEIAPVRYMPRRKTLLVAEGLEVVVECEGGGALVENELEASQLPMYRAIVANFAAVEAEAETHPPAPRAAALADTGADILIIAYDAFIPALAPLVAWREGQGYDVEVVGISEIYEPNDDTDDERIEALRTWLVGVMDPVTGWDPRPGFVLLVGDKAEITPAYFVGTYGDTGWSDHHFACVIGTDWYGDLAIGRFSASTTTDVTNQVNKTLFYEQNAQAHCGVGGASGGLDGDFERCEDCKIELLMEAGEQFSQSNYNARDGSNYNTFVHAFNGTVDPATGKDFWPGTGIITVDTHGSSGVWGGLLSIGSCNNTTMTNRHYFPIAFISACYCGSLQVEDCIMEKLQQIRGGTVANSGSATLACGGTSDQLLNIAVQGLLGVDPPYRPDRFEYTISPNIGYVPIVGQAMAIARNEYLTYFGNPDGWNVKECMMQYNLLGDPALVTDFRSPPRITGFEIVGSSVSLEWTPIYPRYTVEYRNFGETSWQPVPGTAWPIKANTWTGDNISAGAVRFYRVIGNAAQ